MKSIYTYYKERLIEISGKNRSLYLKNFNKKNGYDVGRILSQNVELTEELLDCMLNGKSVPFDFYGKQTKELFVNVSNINSKYPDKTFEDEKEKNKYELAKRKYEKKDYEQEGKNLQILKLDIEEIEKDTGTNE